MSADTETHPGRERDWLEIVATVILSIAAVATAWSSYQATRWNGETTRAAGRSTATRIEAARAAGRANAETQVDVATFIQWIDARAHGEVELERFYKDRFRAEFETAFDAWVATDPLVAPDAAPTPFAMEEYKLASATRAEQLDAQAEELTALVRRNVERAGNYVLAVVLFAVALFFAGMSAKLTGRGSRTALVVVAALVFLGTLARVATFPISIQI